MRKIKLKKQKEEIELEDKDFLLIEVLRELSHSIKILTAKIK